MRTYKEIQESRKLSPTERAKACKDQLGLTYDKMAEILWVQYCNNIL